MTSQGTVTYITDGNFEELLDSFAAEGSVFIPRAVTNREGIDEYQYVSRSAGVRFEYYGYRPSLPLKTFLFKGRIKVADYPSKAVKKPSLDDDKTFVIGAAACDIVSLKSLDVIFLQDEFTDIFYRARRENTFIVSMDCTEPRDTCFCTLAGHGPHPAEGFDLNLSRAEGGYIVQAGSEWGEKVIKANTALFSKPDDRLIGARDEQRTQAEKKVKEINAEYTLTKNRHDILETQRESDGWYEHVRTCVECGACLFACPTCHCFLLFDQEGEDGLFERIKKWDVCVYGGYSRMAGGSSPRLGLMERFRHRYLHKLEYYPKNFGFEACTGCGRCIEGCMGKIDMRKVLKALDSETVGVK